jgi:hypothetical protein
VLTWQAVIAVALVLVLAIAKQVVAAREVGPDPLSALPGGQPVAAGLDIGGGPADYQLVALAASYRVDGVVSLGGPSVAEQATAASLHLGYLQLAVAAGAAPTWAQLQTAASFMRAHARNGGVVYLQDDATGDRAVVTAAMLLLLRGDSWATVRRDLTAPTLSVLGRGQARAADQLMSALDSPGASPAGNPYAKARVDPW